MDGTEKYTDEVTGPERQNTVRSLTYAEPGFEFLDLCVAVSVEAGKHTEATASREALRM